MLERYTHPTDAETRRAVASASRLTRVGTKTGTATTPRTHGQGPVVRRWLEWNELMWPTALRVGTSLPNGFSRCKTLSDQAYSRRREPENWIERGLSTSHIVLQPCYSNNN